MAGDEAPQYDFKRTGKVDFEQCTKDEQLKKLEPALQRLNESLSGFKYDRKGLALLLAGMQQFMEDALGIHVSFNHQLGLIPINLYISRRTKQAGPPTVPSLCFFCVCSPCTKLTLKSQPKSLETCRQMVPSST